MKHPVLRALDAAPMAEPLSRREGAAIAKARANPGRMIPHAEVMAKLRARRETDNPVLFGRRMRTRVRNQNDVVIWAQRHGGVTLVLAYDGRPDVSPWRAEDRWHWQVDAWTRNGALRGATRTQAAAVRKLEAALRKVARSVWRADGLGRDVAPLDVPATRGKR